MINLYTDILLVTATKVESTAVFEVFEQATEQKAQPCPIDDRIYFDLGKVNGSNIFLVQSEMGSTGPGASLQTVQKGIKALRPVAVIMVGIAFGMNDQKQLIGEILVTEQLRLYDLQRVGKENECPQLRLRGDKPHASSWLINRLKSAELVWKGARVRFGSVLTGDKLVDDIDFREQLRQFEAEAIGGEMEGAGLYVSCLDQKVDWILVKAICDWADGNKSQEKDLRQRTAATNASNFILHALEFAPHNWGQRHQQTKSDIFLETGGGAVTSCRAAIGASASKDLNNTRNRPIAANQLDPNMRSAAFAEPEASIDRKSRDIYWEHRDSALLRLYFERCAVYEPTHFGGLGDDLVGTQNYLITSGLADQNRDGRIYLTPDGILLCCRRQHIPRDLLHVHVKLKQSSNDTSLNEELYGSVLYLYTELYGRLTPLFQRRMGSPDIRDGYGAERVFFEYPEIAIVEALANFLIHRDYSIDDQGYITIYRDRIEFMNPGKSDIPPDELLAALSELRPRYKRNPRLIEAMNKARFNQAEGGGILRIKKALADNGSYRPSGALGLLLKNDDASGRFICVIYRRLMPIEEKQIASSLPTRDPQEDLPKMHSSLPIQPFFFGRENELATIARSLAPESRTWGALIEGPGGIGKTALAVRAGHLANNDQFPLKIFLSAKKQELTPSGEQSLKDFMLPNYFALLSELARELGAEEITRIHHDERANTIRRSLAGKRVLIVIDNIDSFENEEQIRICQFLERLDSGCKAIVTSRHRLQVPARVISLRGLVLKEAIDLMKELSKSNIYLSRSTELEQNKLYNIIQGNPLLIKWVAGQLGMQGSRCRTITDAVQYLQTASKEKSQDPLEYIFGDLLATFTLNETAVLAMMAHFAEPVKIEWIAELSGLTSLVAQTAIEDLIDRAVLVRDEHSQTVLFPSLAATLLRQKRPELVAMIADRLVTYACMLIPKYSGNFERSAKLESKWQLIAAALPIVLQGQNSRLQELCGALSNFLESSGRWDELLSFSQRAEEKAVTAADFENAGRRAFDVAWVFSLRSQVRETLDWTERCESHWKKAGVGAKEMARAIRLRGAVYRLQKDYIAAVATYQKALALHRSVESESVDVSIDLNWLANAEMALGNYQEAERDYREALRIARSLGFREGIASYTGNLAALALRLQDWLTAESLARDALALSEEMNRLEFIASYCCILGKALAQQGHQQKGLPYAKRAVGIYTKLHQQSNLEYAQSVLKNCFGEPSG